MRDDTEVRVHTLIGPCSSGHSHWITTINDKLLWQKQESFLKDLKIIANLILVKKKNHLGINEGESDDKIEVMSRSVLIRVREKKQDCHNWTNYFGFAASSC